jgi:Ca2+-transporting ATPase
LTTPQPAWHTLAVEAVYARLKASSEGLTQAEAERRLAEYGPNELLPPKPISPWSILLDQFKNVLIVILLGAALLSGFLGHGVEAIAIAVIVLFAVLLGFVQEYRAENAIEALHRMAAPTATALRDGDERELAARDLVPGDILLLQTGDRIPADCRLIEAINLRVEESALTGESMAVEKHPEALADAELALGDRRNFGFAGTAVTYGRGRAIVVETGMNTEFGAIARMLQAVEEGRTPLQDNLDKVGASLARVAFAVVAVIVALGVWRGQPVIDMLIFGVALAVAVVPEALPAVVTISLAIGVQRMVKRHALVRRLPAVETLGSTTVICSDKTGTLTKDEMTARKLYVAGRTLDVTGAGYAPEGGFVVDGQPVDVVDIPEPALQLLRATLLASDAHLVYAEADKRWSVRGDPTEGAMLVAAAKAGLNKAEIDARFPRLHEIPFSSESKRMTTIHQAPEGLVAYAKGAPEILLESCTQQLGAEGQPGLGGAGEIALDAAGRAAILAVAQQMAGDALRVLAVAAKPGATPDDAERGMTFLGLVGLIDPPRPEVQAAIEACKAAGIKAVMITGDHPLTARAVAGELGMLQSGRVVTGAELDAMSDAELERDVETIEVYARVSPAHKLRVVTALQKRAHIVAMTGDGVNDAPALKKADIGIAMGLTGTDVTKDAADMMLTDDNFASIVAAVEEGRGIFGNIKKYLMYLLSSNIGEIGLMAGAAALGLPLPLTAVQILYVNLATDGLPALALAFDPPEDDLMQRPPRNPRTGIFTRPVVALMTIGGFWSAVVNLGLFAWALGTGRSQAEAMTMAFVSLVLIQFVKAYNFRSDRHSALHHPLANRWLNRAILWELVLLVLIVLLPFLREVFGTYPLPPQDWLIVVLLSVTVAPVLEIAKWMVRRGWFGDAE